MEGEPRYLAATFASSLSEDHSVELDRIRSAFTSTGFVAMSKLPSDMRAGAVMQSRTSQIVQNRAMRPKPAKRIRSLQLFGVFDQPKHLPAHNSESDARSLERISGGVLADIQSPKPPFVAAGTSSGAAKSPMSRLNDSTAPYLNHSMSSVAMASRGKQDPLAVHAGDESTFLAGRFHTSTRVQEEVRRGVVRDVKPIAKAIYEDLCKHWSTLKFTVSSPDGRHIRVTIDAITLQQAGVPDELLCSYLSALGNQGRLGEHAIFRDPSQWDVEDGQSRVFVFWPEWERVTVMHMTRKSTAAKQRSKARAFGRAIHRTSVAR